MSKVVLAVLLAFLLPSMLIAVKYVLDVLWDVVSNYRISRVAKHKDDNKD